MTEVLRRASLPNRIALGVPLALLGGAYLSQYGFGLAPCEMCWWQRYALIAALPFAVLGWLRPSLRLVTALALLGILAGGLIGGFHAGVEYGWWEGLTACSTGVKAGAGNALDAILDAPVIRCDVAPWSLLGISLAGWNFLISVPLALVGLAGLRKGA
ncbi:MULTISPECIES: disulfide bond formation protein B [unclassified Novosphingobium]|uniref:disulfide bond formation protein B n=1 Tax=unclassified Novosphingobium TaxID=2644732 RepID=UPI000ECAE855|nr:MULTISPECIES: disulfide bond formation protein B [unclassified Novosphingobium]HCF24278.1 disulfide bond formation protein B [Novosphingobium sp.]HQV02473.1 disulfide bond formation protein B [Novosphingobium sp.]